MTVGIAPLNTADVEEVHTPRVTAIPVSWVDAASFLADLRECPPLDDSEWEVVAEWLISTEFDDRSYLAAEVAGGLVRDFAPDEIKSQLARQLPTDRWHQHVRRIVESR